MGGLRGLAQSRDQYPLGQDDRSVRGGLGDIALHDIRTSGLLAALYSQSACTVSTYLHVGGMGEGQSVFAALCTGLLFGGPLLAPDPPSGLLCADSGYTAGLRNLCAAFLPERGALSVLAVAGVPDGTGLIFRLRR